MNLVPGYQSNAPIDPKVISANVPPVAFETIFKNAGQKPQFDHETVLQEIKILIQMQGDLSGLLLVLLAFQLPLSAK
jgi:hypothetical protein